MRRGRRGVALLGWLLGPVGGFGATIPSLPLPQSFVVEMGYSGLLAFVIMGCRDRRANAGERRAVRDRRDGVRRRARHRSAHRRLLQSGAFARAGARRGVWTAHWLYWVAPIAGMCLAMRLYDALRGARVPASPPDVPTGVEGPIGG